MNKRKAKPTMIDVARRAGVSTMTVSRALRDNESVAVKTREKILDVVQELGYVIDLSAGSLSSQKTGFVAVLIPSINNSNFSETLHGLSEVLLNHSKQVLLGYTDYSKQNEEKLIETMLQRRPEGIIVTGGVHTKRARQLLENASIPVIETWDLPKTPIDHVVGFSNAAMIEELVERLMSRGYRNIAFMGGDDSADSRGIDRRRGYERAVEKFNLPKAHEVSVGIPPITIEHGKEAVTKLLDEWPQTQAVICVSDLPAFGIIMECLRRNIAIPERLAVAGFGDFEISRYCCPSITTVSVNCWKIGQQAGLLMVEALDSQHRDDLLPSRTITIPHKIIERESTEQA